jgi:hypothetical protein
MLGCAMQSRTNTTPTWSHGRMVSIAANSLHSTDSKTTHKVIDITQYDPVGKLQ